jgi:hypothetical protein
MGFFFESFPRIIRGRNYLVSNDLSNMFYTERHQGANFPATFLFQTSGCSMRLVASVIGFGYDEKTSHVVSVMGNKEGPTKAESWASS